MEKPKGAQYEVDGLFYKIGVHDKVFFWAGDRWQSSTRTKILKLLLAALN